MRTSSPNFVLSVNGTADDDRQDTEMGLTAKIFTDVKTLIGKVWVKNSHLSTNKTVVGVICQERRVRLDSVLSIKCFISLPGLPPALNQTNGTEGSWWVRKGDERKGRKKKKGGRNFGSYVTNKFLRDRLL